MPMPGLLHVRADRGPVAYTAAVLAVQLVIFFAVDNLWIAALSVLLFQPLQAVAIACNHYQHHRNVWTRPFLNRIYEIALFLQTGTPPFAITLHHNLGHHLHYLEGSADTLAWRRPDGSPLSFGECLWRNSVGHLQGTIAIGRRHPRIYRRLKAMLAPSLLPLLAFALLDWRKTLIVFVGPMLLALANVARLGYHQHAGLDADDHLEASRNDEGRLYNLVTFNSGYHAAHHLKPGLHWSRLPELHRQIRARIPEQLLKGYPVAIERAQAGAWDRLAPGTSRELAEPFPPFTPFTPFR